MQAMTVIRRERIMPVPGEILTGEHQLVDANEVIGRYNAESQIMIVEAALSLGIEPEALKDHLLIDDPLETDDLILVGLGEELAVKRSMMGLARKVVRAPEDGQVVLIDNGRIIMITVPEAVDFQASIPGEVINIMGDQGVRIETTGALIQGVWGSGGSEFGPLRVVGGDKRGILPADAIHDQMAGTIVASRLPLSMDAIQMAVENRVRGLVAPAIAADLRKRAGRLSIPIMLTQGFGDFVMADPVYELLAAHEGRSAALDAASAEAWGSERPELAIPLPSPDYRPELPRIGVPLDVGDRVKMLRDPMRGQIGTVVNLPETPRTIESGLRVLGAEIELPGNRFVFVPFANLELLG
jgi:hypothetical protein